ncbi:hypothetical protein AMAG_02686 [Allomyces macrogynus ATCC 38327]|uniref:Diacylglycerol O-acyltransferase n=1 Tax=Allomyces macrogynus (strain ATCC 38327) TaxID=578462 RepID=A0A0L0S3C5_ALLM3|nr:hypothetical protein AMAG_02686 [Allomyces macrogynus ATCC 38327]|eukprot:KNE56915.1 hypothetical protein AMAG_02686 [Allomyces macrogynus ATCC 38327]
MLNEENTRYPPNALNVFGIRFAPLNVPIERRKQTLGTLIWLTFLPGSFILSFLFLYLSYTRLVFLAYLGWIWFWDKAPENGGRASDFVRRMTFWKWMASYFPMEIRKDAELDPSRNYLVGYHPHGAVAIGAWVNFGTEATGFSDIFPGIKLNLLTLLSNFNIPIFRDIVLALGVASVSRKSIEHIFRQGPGHSVAIVIGGAQECLYAKPHTIELVLRKRLGFIKVAILNGALLVPALTFGENEAYDLFATNEESIAWQIQQWCKRTWGWTMPAYFGRGAFNYSLGVLPHRRRITTVMAKAVDPEEVVGHPIDPHSLTKEELLDITQKVHQAYIDRIYEVWNKYKDELAPDRIKELELVE